VCLEGLLCSLLQSLRYFDSYIYTVTNTKHMAVVYVLFRAVWSEWRVLHLTQEWYGGSKTAETENGVCARCFHFLCQLLLVSFCC
jgi:hypothetical protein